MIEGETATLRTNSLSVIAKLPGKENADLVVQVLESDLKVRRLILASEISRLTQLDWDMARKAADDPTLIPDHGRSLPNSPRELSTHEGPNLAGPVHTS